MPESVGRGGGAEANSLRPQVEAAGHGVREAGHTALRIRDVMGFTTVTLIVSGIVFAATMVVASL